MSFKTLFVYYKVFLYSKFLALFKCLYFKNNGYLKIVLQILISCQSVSFNYQFLDQRFKFGKPQQVFDFPDPLAVRLESKNGSLNLLFIKFSKKS